MRRIFLVVMVALVMAAMLVTMAMPAFAQGREHGRGPEVAYEKAEPPGPPPPFGGTEPEAVGHACKGLNNAEHAPFKCS